jgi:hypothetical protein
MTTTTNTINKPLFLLDIDGVLNLFDARIPTGKHWWDTKGRMRVETTIPEHLRAVRVAGYELVLHPDHPDMIELVESEFEPVWATMWQSNAWRAGLELGFGVDWDYIDFDSYYSFEQRAERLRMGAGVGPYKQPGIADVLGDRPGVWVDDDMTPEQLAWAKERTAAGIPTLFIQPDPATGMTWDHVDAIITFAEDLKVGTVAP